MLLVPYLNSQFEMIHASNRMFLLLLSIRVIQAKMKDFNCCEISKDKIAVCEKTAGIRSENFSYLNSARP